MAFEMKENSGSLFKNDRKEKDSHPDYKGQCKIDGTEYWLAAWLKESKNGKFFSMAFTPKDEAPRQGGSTGSIDNLESDIPFGSASVAHDPMYRKLRWPE